MARSELNDALEKYRRRDEPFGAVNILQFITSPEMQDTMNWTTEQWEEYYASEDYTDTELNDDGVYEPVDD